MRPIPKWIPGAAMPIAIGALAAAVAVPAMAQQSGGQHHVPVPRLQAVTTCSVPKGIPAQATPVAGQPVIAGATGTTGTTGAASITVVPVPGNPKPTHVTRGTAKPLPCKPVIAGATGITGVAPITVVPVPGNPKPTHVTKGTAKLLPNQPVIAGPAGTTGAAPS
jgi:hypothetical protein